MKTKRKEDKEKGKLSTDEKLKVNLCCVRMK